MLKLELSRLKNSRWSFIHPKMGVAFFLVLILSSVPPILLFGAWLGQKQSEEASFRFDRESRIRARSVEEGVRELITLKREVLDVIAGTLSVLEEWNLDTLQKITDAQITSSGSFDAFYVGSLEGISLVIAPSIRPDGTRTHAGVNYQDRDYFQELLKTKQIVFGRMKLGKQSNVANIHIAVPIYKDLILKEKGSLRGYIGAGIKPKLIEQVVSRILKGNTRLRAVLVEQDKRVISDSDRQVPIYTLLSKESIYGQPCEDSHSYLGVDLNEVPVRAICKTIALKSLQWNLWISTPQEVINTNAKHSISFTIQISLLLLVAVLLVAGTLSYWVVNLMKLITENAQKVSMGLFEVNLPKTRWFTPREIIEVGEITLQTISRLHESDRQVKDLVYTLEQTNQRQAPLVEAWKQVSEAIEILGVRGETLFVNPAFYDLLNPEFSQSHTLSSQSLLFYLFPITTHPRSVGSIILSHAKMGLSWSSEIEVTQDKKCLIHEIHSSPVLDESGQLSQIVVIRRDVTEERIAQASAAHNDRLAAIGTLAAGMAHEINNPLTYIKMSLDLIQEELHGASKQEGWRWIKQEVYEDLDEAIYDASEGVDRVSHIVQSLLSIARSGGQRGSNETMSNVSLIDIVSVCSSLVRSKLSSRVELEIDVDHELRVLGRRSELIQVILNLLINAAQAMPKNRTSGDWIKIVSSVTELGDVQLSVSDNACGIPADDLERIFEPFFSSKSVGEGSGLGLAVSHGIIEAHQATISVKSVEGQGTMFTITFTMTQDLEDQTETLKSPQAYLNDSDYLLNPASSTIKQINTDKDELTTHSTSGVERKILIVDDDLLVAKSLGKMLRQDHVVTSSNGLEALQLLADSQFDLIISDVMMPIMDGPTFYQEVVAHFPHYQKRFIFITGAAKNSTIAQAVQATERPVLNKPLTKQQLLTGLYKVMATLG